MFEVTELWKNTYPGASAGVLIMHRVENPARHAILEDRKAALETRLRSTYTGKDRSAIKSDPIMQAYEVYYRRFKKTYHVQLQLESIAFKGKSIPNGSALVEAMFMAEVKNLLLTAGHDLQAVKLPITLDVSTGEEHYTLLRGSEQVLKAGDMMMFDRAGIISSILYGPDLRTQIHPGTQDVVYTVYAPAGIERAKILRHLQDIQETITEFSPHAHTEMMQVVLAKV
jgi:DNA/RNA-binding domain of Phe-tRNA-synthetase-like protein